MKSKQPAGPLMTFSNMRELGVRGLNVLLRELRVPAGADYGTEAAETQHPYHAQ